MVQQTRQESGGGYIASNINGTEIELGGDIIIGMDNQTVNSVYDIRNYK